MGGANGFRVPARSMYCCSRKANGAQNPGQPSTRSLTDRASDYGSEGCRFESCRVHSPRGPPVHRGASCVVCSFGPPLPSSAPSVLLREEGWLRGATGGDGSGGGRRVTRGPDTVLGDRGRGRDRIAIRIDSPGRQGDPHGTVRECARSGSGFGAPRVRAAAGARGAGTRRVSADPRHDPVHRPPARAHRQAGAHGEEGGVPLDPVPEHHALLGGPPATSTWTRN